MELPGNGKAVRGKQARGFSAEKGRTVASPLLESREGNAYILGRPVLSGNMADALEAFAQLRGAGGTHLVVTANVDHLLDLDDRTELAHAYERASLRTVDGMPVLWTLRALGAQNVHRVTGADLLEETAAASARTGWRIVVTGGSTPVLREAVAQLRRKHPGADLHAVPMPFLSDPADARSRSVISDLHECRPDITFLCMGAPKQESWYVEWRESLPEGIYIGAGAAVDFAAGTKSRAPRLLQRTGFEWTWRLAQDARRLAPRYLVKGPRFLSVFVRAMQHSRRRA